MGYTPNALPFTVHMSHDGGTTTDYAIDVSGTDAVEAVCQPPAGERWAAQRLVIYIEDSGNPSLVTYGNSTDVSEGVRLQYKDDTGVLADLDAGEPITSNGDWAHLMYDWTHQAWGALNYYMVGRYTFSKFCPDGIVLNGDDPNNPRLALTLQDDFSDLASHKFVVEGYKWRGKGGFSV